MSKDPDFKFGQPLFDCGTKTWLELQPRRQSGLSLPFCPDRENDHLKQSPGGTY